LNTQRTLHRLYDWKTDRLMAQGRAALAGRQQSLGNKTALCRFGDAIAGRDDTIGRFLDNR